MTQNGSETDSGIARYSFDSIGMNFNPVLSPGQFTKAGKIKSELVIMHFKRKNNTYIKMLGQHYLFNNSCLIVHIFS